MSTMYLEKHGSYHHRISIIGALVIGFGKKLFGRSEASSLVSVPGSVTVLLLHYPQNSTGVVFCCRVTVGLVPPKTLTVGYLHRA